MMKKKPKSSMKRKLSSTSTLTPITVASNTSETSSQMLQLPQDLITEILLFLPIKSLLRFKCVSKQWLSLISDPKFRIRRRRSPSSVVLCRLSDLIHHVPLSWNSSYEPPFTSLSFIGSPVNMTILQCSNGLILCRGLRYYICNPSTRQFTTIPIAVSRPPKSSDVSGVYLLFDPAISPRYEIVCIRTHFLSRIEVYSSETCEWRQCGSPFLVPLDIVLNHGVVWNRAIHWISPTGESLCFHIGRERIVTMPGVPSANEKWSKRRFRYFGESGGHLLLAEVFGSGTTHFPVYEMARDYSSWLPKYHVDLSAIVDAFPKMSIQIPHFTVCYAFSLVFVQDDEDGSFLLLEIPGQYISLNLRNGSFKKLSLIPEIGFPIVHQFRESFAAV